MTLEITRDRFKQIVNSSRTSFLGSLADIHVEWHNTRAIDGSPIGFLSFHREMIKYNVKNRKENNLSAVPKALTLASINSISAWDQSLMDVNSPVTFSTRVEGWHNIFHNSADWPNFHDPRLNIRDDRFWQFHKFIDNRFKKWLKEHDRTYSNIEHRRV
jgi:hypothetical protein